MTNKLTLGCDAGTGTSSAFGFAIYDRTNNEVLHTVGIWPAAQKPTWRRMRDVGQQLQREIVNAIVAYGGSYEIDCHCERFVMQGKGGETLNRMIGMLIFMLPERMRFSEIHNITLKKSVTGNHKANKWDMGQALLTHIPKSATMIQMLIDEERWDEIDAIAIAFCEEEFE